MTLTELAAAVGTSVATVSKAFSGGRDVSEAMRERIFAEAKRLGIFEKYYKGPRERRVVAILTPEPESEFYGNTIGIFERELAARGADTVVALTRFDPAREARLFSEMVYRLRVDGVILLGNGSLIRNPDEVPLVLIGSKNRCDNADRVRINLSGAIEDAVCALKARGHREVGFIGEPLTLGKLEAFRHAMRRHGLALHEKYIVTDSGRFAQAGEMGMRTLIERGAVPTAVIAAYDQIAYGAMRYAITEGYRVPDDISFIGIDDISVTDYLGVPLSSIRMHTEEIAARVVEIIFRRIENRHYRVRQELVIPAKLHLRESVGAVRRDDGGASPV